MAGAKSKTSVYLHRKAVAGRSCAVMGAVDEKPSGLDRLQFTQGLGDPIDITQGFFTDLKGKTITAQAIKNGRTCLRDFIGIHINRPDPVAGDYVVLKQHRGYAVLLK